MMKNLRFEMRMTEDTLKNLEKVKEHYEKRFDKKFSLAQTIDYAIAFEYLRIAGEDS